jgi:hypothetical protein
VLPLHVLISGVALVELLSGCAPYNSSCGHWSIRVLLGVQGRVKEPWAAAGSHVGHVMASSVLVNCVQSKLLGWSLSVSLDGI